VSTTCQESPGNGEDGPGNSEEKGTSTDFDEDDEEGDYYNTGQEVGEVTSGDVADTTFGHSLSNVAEGDNTYVQSIQCDELDDESQSEREEGCGATDLKCDNINFTGASNTCNRDKTVTDDVSVCHIDCSNEPVNLVSKTKHSGENVCSSFVYTTCSNVASSSYVMSSSNNQSKITSTKHSSPLNCKVIRECHVPGTLNCNVIRECHVPGTLNCNVIRECFVPGTLNRNVIVTFSYHITT
jgi:hypothetical protein